NIQNDQWIARPNTLLIDSQQLESGDALSKDFKQIVSQEIKEFEAEFKQRGAGNHTDITDEDLLREVMNTVGRKGKLGENIKCVVSVSMLTEGWDTNTVTHVLGVRAFSSQLLCEQVVGRGLRRVSYETEPQTVTVEGQVIEFEAFPAEYAEVYGVPFEFIPTAGGTATPKPPKETTHVYSVETREDSCIIFPNVLGYHYELIGETLEYEFDAHAHLKLNTKDIPTITENAPIAGESVVHGIDTLKRRRLNEVAFSLSQLILEQFFQKEESDKGIVHVMGQHVVQNQTKFWLFSQVLKIVKYWMRTCLICQDDTFPQLLLYEELRYRAIDKILPCLKTKAGKTILKPILDAHHSEGSTEGLDYHTSKPTYVTNQKSHLSHIVLDSTWERKMAQSLEYMDEIKAYVKNNKLDFKIPYSFEGKQHHYIPDFIAKVEDGHDDLLNIIIEVSGEKRDDKDSKVETVKNLWVPAVNNTKQFGRWAICEVTDPYAAKQTIRDFLKKI
ncbi:MAG: hypothetical protein KAH77_11225, partial [Thiomargarita sp.]|nr:hypothetical protein [Thiomargarita sp.]